MTEKNIEHTGRGYAPVGLIPMTTSTAHHGFIPNNLLQSCVLSISKCTKTIFGRCSAPDLLERVYNAPSDPLTEGKGSPPHTSHQSPFVSIEPCQHGGPRTPKGVKMALITLGCQKAETYNSHMLNFKEKHHTHFVWFLQFSSNIYSNLLLQQTLHSVPDKNYNYRPSVKLCNFWNRNFLRTCSNWCTSHYLNTSHFKCIIQNVRRQNTDPLIRCNVCFCSNFARYSR